jgi:hypothetical protein
MTLWARIVATVLFFVVGRIAWIVWPNTRFSRFVR